MKQILKDNFVLAVGIALPLVLVLIFFLAGTLNRQTVADPQFDAVLAIDYYANQAGNPFDISVDNGDLFININEKMLKDNPHYQKPRLFTFDHQTLRVREIDLDYGDLASGTVEDADLAALNQRNIIADSESPDGYRLDYHYRSGGGIFGELFGFSSYRRNHNVLVKDGRSIPLEGLEPYYQVTLIGWITE